LRDVQNPGSVGSRGPSIPLDPQLISKLNFTDGTSAGNLDMFSRGAQGLEWPLALQAPNFKEDRDSITSLTADAIRQAGSAGKIEFGIITNLRSAVDRMAESLRGQVDDLTPTDYMQAKRFLQDLSKSARALGDPNAAQVLAGKWKPRAATVSELITAMSKQGLQFAPVTPGNEAAYNTAYQALRAYDTYSSQMATGPRKR
jgi:hypothetical protein